MWNRRAHRAACISVVVGVLIAGAAPTLAHAQGLPGGMTAEQAARLLQERPELAAQARAQLFQSGMTPDQIRRQLSAQGYTPFLLDQLLTEQAPGTALTVSTDMVQALQLLGVAPISTEVADSLTVAAGRQPVAAPPDRRLITSRLFGFDVFRGRTTQFQPLMSGPVPDAYRIGPGDVMVLVLTGDAEQVHQLQVTREGFIVIPQIGQMFVNSLTVSELRRVLEERLARSFSGIRRGTTHFDVTIARLRTIQIYVIGEVAQPGAYQIASVSTVLTALYAAGGPTELANFRQIQVQRQSRTAGTLDLYEYLLHGSVTNDIILEQGDVIFVPVHGARVSVSGAVVRPALYELKAGETLADATAMAGGLRPDAQVRRLAIYRIVPPDGRLPGPVPRMVVDVPLGRPATSEASGASGAASGPRVVIPPIPLEPGDSIFVDSILAPEGSLSVSIWGMVNKSGAYPWSDGMTVRDLVRLARGPSVGADLREAEIARLPDDRSGGALARAFRVPLDSTFLFERDSSGAYLGPPGLAFPAPGTAAEVKLVPYDQVTIFRQPGFEFQRTVWVTGEILFPGPYALTRKDERVSDVIQRAGGPLASAYMEGARFFRSADSTGRVDLDLPAALRSAGNAEDLVLQPGDSLFVPEHNPTVRVTGAVNSPVSVRYVEGQGLSYYVGNAGGYASAADKGRVSVRYADGSARVKTRFLLFSSSPSPGPGSTIFVPTKPADGRGIDLAVLFGGIAQVLSAVTTMILVAQRL